jgi:phenylalanine-4-hydroxylase
LIREAGASKIFGGGILSSPKEITHSLDLEQVSHHPFDIDTILRTRYRIDIPQPNYFVMESTEQLLGIQDKTLLTRIDNAISDLKSAVI